MTATELSNRSPRARSMGSLARRLALLAGLWVAAGLGAAGWFVTGFVARQLEEAFDARLSALLDRVAAGAELDARGRPGLRRPPEGADFEQPFSGAYWQITGPDGTVATSRSLWDHTLPLSGDTGWPEVLLRNLRGPRGESLRLAEREIVPRGADAPLHVAAALSREPLDASIGRLRWVLGLVFALLGLGLVLVVALQVVAGLAPLRRATRALAEVRAGTRERLALPSPVEIAPLVEEIDALIAQNRATVERARAHVGNLAHALKTPVAVLRNALAAPSPDLAAARAETATLERLVQHHLARARATALAAGAAGAAEQAPLALAMEIAAALRRLFAARRLTVEVTGDAAARLRIARQDLTEMLGNLMENACKWARGHVVVRVASGAEGVTLEVEDDGPGLPPGHAAAALARGGRLDEAVPGTGLGLAIVGDLVALHGGRLILGRGALGGLSVRLAFPRSAGVAVPAQHAAGAAGPPGRPGEA